jgi:hypothetical protein
MRPLPELDSPLYAAAINVSFLWQIRSTLLQEKRRKDRSETVFLLLVENLKHSFD